MAENDREPIRIDLDDTAQGLTLGQLRDLEVRAEAGDAEAQAQLDAALADLQTAIASVQPALRAQLDKVAKMVTPADLSKFAKTIPQLDVSKFHLASKDAAKAAAMFREVKIPPLVQEAMRDAAKFEIEPLGPSASVRPTAIVQREVQEVVHDVRMAHAIESLNDQLRAMQKRGNRWQAATFVVTVAGVVVAVIVGGG